MAGRRVHDVTLVRQCRGEPRVRPVGRPLRPAAPEVVEGALHPAASNAPFVRGDRLEVERRRLGRVVRPLAGERVVEHDHVRHAEHGRAGGKHTDGTSYGGSDAALQHRAVVDEGGVADPHRLGREVRREQLAQPLEVRLGCRQVVPGVEGTAGDTFDDDDVARSVDGERRAAEALPDALDRVVAQSGAGRIRRDASQVGQAGDPLRGGVRRARRVDREQRREPAAAGRDDDEVVVAGQVLEVVDRRDRGSPPCRRGARPPR